MIEGCDDDLSVKGYHFPNKGCGKRRKREKQRKEKKKEKRRRRYNE